MTVVRAGNGSGGSISGEESKPVIQLINFIIKSNNFDIVPQGSIYWIDSRNKLDITADIIDESGVISDILSVSGNSKSELIVVAERIRNGDVGDVIDDVRFGVEVDSTILTLTSNKGFDVGGNYVITQERLNRGLLAIEAPFRIEMEKIEFDILND